MSNSREPSPQSGPRAEMDSGKLKHAVRAGARTASIAQAVSQVVSIAVLACLFHWIAPDDFGLIGMVLPVLLLLRNLSTMGLNVATIQRPSISPAELSSIFWLNLTLGVVAAAVTAALAPLLVRLYGGRDELAALTYVLAGTTLLAAAGASHQALLERHMRWVPLALARLVAQSVAGAAAIGAALAGWGVWSLVLQQYVEMLVLAIAFWCVEPWRPLGPRRGAPVADLVTLGSFFSAANLMSFLMTNIDKVLVGAALGPRALGLYHQSFNLMMKPGYVLTTPLAGIMLPALSRARRDLVAYRELLLAFCRLIAVTLFPVAAGLFVVAPEVMLVLGGRQWSAAGAVLAALAPALVVQGFVNVAATVFASSGRTARLLAASSVLAAVMCAAFGAAVWLGRWWRLPVEEAVTLVAWSYSLGIIVLAIPYLCYCMRTVGLPACTWWAAAARPATAAAVMGGVVWGARRWLMPAWQLPPAATLSLLVGAGVVIYAVLAWPDLVWLYRQARKLRRRAISG